MLGFSKILSSGNKVIRVSVPVCFFKYNGERFIYAECLSLRIITYAETLERAKEMFQEAFDLWLEVATESGIKEELRGLGWKVEGTSVIPKNENCKFPLVKMLASRTVSLQIEM